MTMQGYSGSARSLGTRSSLHAVVIDYIAHHGYVETARELARPGSSKAAAHLAGSSDMEVDEPVGGSSKASDSDPPVVTQEMLQEIEQRREIIDFVLNGSIDQALDGLNTHFPGLLTSSKAADKQPSRPADQKRAESLVNHGNGHTNGHNAPTPYIMPVFHTSLNPDHVRLNLEIQRFIELFRKASTPSSPSSSEGSMSDSNGSLGMTQSLAFAHDLNAEVNKLSPEDQGIYRQEVKDAGALLAYTNPETSILKGFLDQKRRIALAEQVNKAMLNHRGHRTTTQLDDYARRTSHILNVMEHYGLNAVPQWTAADGPERDTLAAYIKHRGGFDLAHFAQA